LPGILDYLSAIRIPSVFLTLLAEICSFPAALLLLLKLLALGYSDLLFSDGDLAAFFLAVR
jgi:hypothetical protein